MYSFNHHLKVLTSLIFALNLKVYADCGKWFKEKGLKTVEEVGEETEAGTVCGQCQDDIQEILDEINGK